MAPAAHRTQTLTVSKQRLPDKMLPGASATAKAEPQQQTVQQQLDFKNAQLKALFDLTKCINENKKRDQLLELYANIMFYVMGIDKMAVYTQYSNWGYTTGYGVDDKFKHYNIHNELSNFTMWNRLAELDHELASDFEYVVPTYHKNTPIAVTLLGTSDQITPANIEESLVYVQTISNIVAVAIENKKFAKEEQEQKAMMRFADQTVRTLLPSNEQLPKTEHFESLAEYIPSKVIGGDYYDSLMLNEDEVMLCIGDISGKGPAAAVLMSHLQAHIRVLIRKQDSLKDFIQDFNREVNAVTKGEKFMTLFVAKYNVITRKLHYVNAGHNPPVLVNSGNCTTLGTGCTLLGMFDTLPKVEVGVVTLLPGALLFCYTDGLLDVENVLGEALGEQRLFTLVENSHEMPIAAFNNRILDYLIDYKGAMSYFDDVTYLTTRFH